MSEIIEELSKNLFMDLHKHIEEFACAYYQKTNADPRKIVMISHTDYTSGKTYYWFEKKRGRSRKEILNNAKSHEYRSKPTA